MLDQDAEEAFDGTEERAVDHERLVLGAVFGDVFETEARGKIEIELDGGELPGAADGVDQLDVDFGAVERGFAGDGFIRNVKLLHGFCKSGSGTLPVFGLAGVILRVGSVPVGELDFVVVKAKILHYGKREINAGFYFAFDLRGCAENVRIILRKAADAEQAMEYAAALIAVDSAEFGETHRKIAITVEF